MRRVMLYGGLFYLLYGFIIFIFIKLLSTNPAKTITPGYWTPPSIFDINRRTGGYGIEDALFSFFAGGIAACLYELMFKLKVSKKTNKKLKRGHALSFALIMGSLIFVFTPVNAIYLFIFLQFFGALAIIHQRRDLVLHAVLGGIFFMLLYGMLFLIFNLLFPTFIHNYYHLQRTTHILFLGVPLEEFLFALTLGMMWAPLYEYEHRVKDRKNRRHSLVPRRFSLAAGATRR